VSVQHAMLAPRPAAGPRGRWTMRRVRAGAGGASTVLVVGALSSAAFAWAFVPPLIVAIDAAHRHRIFLGIAGMWPMDQLQYLAWATDAGAHGLIRNLYGRGGGAVFVHPLWTPTGLIESATGASAAAVMLFWQALSVLAVLAGCLRLIWRRLGSRGGARRGVAVALCLFGGLTPLVAALPLMDRWGYSPDYLNAAGGLVNGTALWGYAPLAVALGLMPFAIDQLDGALAGAEAGRWLRASALGLLISWLHPWQGEELLLIAAGLWVWQWRERDRPRLQARRPRVQGRRAQVYGPAVFAAAAASPLIYYWALSRLDVGWGTSARDAVTGSVIPWPVIVTCLAPLAVVTLLAARAVKIDRGVRPLLLWPAAVLATVLVTPNGQYRALAGVALPLGVLAVRAWPAFADRRRGRWTAVAALSACLAPTIPYLIDTLARLDSPLNVAYTELAPSDVRAARFAAAHARGRPILAPVGLATAIPALTDAWVWAGHPIWTPDHLRREVRLQQLFSGWMAGPRARAFVSATRTAAVIQPCGYGAPLSGELAPLGFRETVIGCAHVYTQPARSAASPPRPSSASTAAAARSTDRAGQPM
jgi:hypothetical protein